MFISSPFFLPPNPDPNLDKNIRKKRSIIAQELLILCIAYLLDRSLYLTNSIIFPIIWFWPNIGCFSSRFFIVENGIEKSRIALFVEFVRKITLNKSF